MSDVIIDHVAAALPGKDGSPGGLESNEELIRSLGGKERVGGLDPEKFERVFGIESRFLMSPIDPETGKAEKPSQVDEIAMATTAAKKILDQTDITAEEIDGLFFVTATQNHARFNEASQKLCQEVGLINLSFGNEMAVGCGGVGIAFVQADRNLRGSEHNNALIVASHAPSKHIHAELYAEEGQYINELLFGGGAGAALVRKVSSSESGFISRHSAMRPFVDLMSARNKDEGVLYSLDEDAAGEYYGEFIVETFHLLLKKSGLNREDIDRYYFHQVNGVKLDEVLKDLEIDPKKAPKHVDTLGNLSAASTLVLMAHDRQEGRLERGDMCMLNVMGAGNGAQIAGTIFKY